MANEQDPDMAVIRKLLRPALIVSRNTLVERSTFLGRLLIGLADESIATTLICPGGYNVDSLVPPPISVLTYPLMDLPLIEYFGVGWLASQLAKFKPTVLHGLCESEAALTCRLARRLDLPYVQTVHSLAGRFGHVRVCPQRCAAISAPAETVCKHLREAYPRFADCVRQIHIGTFIEEDTICFSDSSRLTTIVLAQPLRRASDFEPFFRAVKALLAEGREFLVIIMGSGPAEHRLRRLLEKLELSQAVTIVPILEPWRSVLAAGDIFVQPQPAKAFNTFLLEAMGLGTAVAACLGGVDDLLVPDQTAAVFDPNDEQSIRQALTRLLGEPDFARRLAKTAQDHVRADYSVSQMIAATLEMYTQAQQYRD
jgi:glycosyltransferase involved in cell wall biosynthesis